MASVAKARNDKKAVIAALKCVRENWVVPTRLESFVPLHPALKRGAKLARPDGTRILRDLFHRVVQNGVLAHTLEETVSHSTVN